VWRVKWRLSSPRSTRVVFEHGSLAENNREGRRAEGVHDGRHNEQTIYVGKHLQIFVRDSATPVKGFGDLDSFLSFSGNIGGCDRVYMSFNSQAYIQ